MPDFAFSIDREKIVLPPQGFEKYLGRFPPGILLSDQRIHRGQPFLGALGTMDQLFIYGQVLFPPMSAHQQQLNAEVPKSIPM